MAETAVNVPSLLIPVHDGTLILPNAAVAEIVGYRDPESVKQAPEWLLGLIQWRGLQLPLLAYEAAVGGAVPPREGRLRIAVLNTLGGNPELPFFSIVLQGIPRLVTANQGVVSVAPEPLNDPRGALCSVVVNGEPAVIPDLDALERMFNELPAA